MNEQKKTHLMKVEEGKLNCSDWTLCIFALDRNHHDLHKQFNEEIKLEEKKLDEKNADDCDYAPSYIHKLFKLFFFVF